jgi:mannosyltransferase
MSRTGNSARAPVLALAALTAVAAVLRFATLDLQSYWFDESVTVHLLRLGLGDMLGRIPGSESTPPLYYVLAWLWSKPFGLGEAGLRSLSALLGTATVPVAYLAAKELCSRRVGLAVAALAAVNPVLVWYSQEARAYALLVLLTALSLWALALLVRRPSTKAAAGWAVVSALALASHYFAAFLVLPEAIWLAAAPASRRRTTPAVASVTLAALALLPLALHQKSLDLASFITGDSLAFRMARTGKNFLVGFDSPLERELSVVAGLIALGGAAAAFAWSRNAERRGAKVAAALGVLAIALPLLLAIAGVDYLDTRNLLPAWIPLMTVVAAGLLTRRAGVVGLAGLALIGLIAVLGVATHPAWQREDWRGMAQALGRPTGPRAIIVPASGRRALELYLPRLSELPQEGSPVREIAIVYPVRRKAGEEHPLPPPRPATPALAGFTLSKRRFTDSYSVVLVKAPRDVAFNVAAALSLRPVRNESSAVLLQR